MSDKAPSLRKQLDTLWLEAGRLKAAEKEYQQRITDLEAENRELREKYDGAVKECQRLTDLLAMRGEE